MRICTRNIHGKVHCIFHVVVPVACDSHQVSAPAFTFYHIADCLLVKIILRQRSYDQNTVFDERDRAVLQFSGSIGLRMDVADLFHLEASLHADRIVDAPSDKEDISRIGKF